MPFGAIPFSFFQLKCDQLCSVSWDVLLLIYVDNVLKGYFKRILLKYIFNILY